LVASVTQDAGKASLKKAYGGVKDEAQFLDHDYCPKSASTYLV
jgi:hypothetical protein